MSDRRHWLDPRAARLTLERTARVGDTPFLTAEIGRRMAERLDYIKHVPTRILDAGSVRGGGMRALRNRYPDAEIVALDDAERALARVRPTPSLGERLRSFARRTATHLVCGDLSAAAIAPGSCDMLWSNLALAWTDDPAAVIGGWGRALATGGLAMFTTFGPDTLRELAAAFARADDAPHVHAFVDMHDLGDALLAAGFAEPVVDMEILTLTYPGPGALLAELHAAGFANVHVGRRRTLTGRGRWARMLRAYGDSARDGRVPATFEVVYGHAWKGRPRTTADGRAVIHLERPRKGTKNI